MDRPPRKFVRRIALATFAVAVGLTALTWRISSSRADDPYSDELVQVDIGDRGYAIPRNYLSHVTRKDDGRDDRAVLRMLWPGLEPRSPENDEFWRRRYPERQIRIHIELDGIEGIQALGNMLYTASRSAFPFQNFGEPAPYDLLEYSRYFEDGRVDQFFIVSDTNYVTPNGHPIVFNCTDNTTSTAKNLFDVALLCISQYRLSDNAWIKVHLFKVNLEQWREIDVAVRSLIDGLRR